MKGLEKQWAVWLVVGLVFACSKTSEQKPQKPEQYHLVEHALRLSARMADPRQRVRLLTHLAAGYAKMGDFSEALALLEKSATQAGQLGRATDRDLSLLEISKSFAEIGQFDRAMATSIAVRSPEVSGEARTQVVAIWAKKDAQAAKSSAKKITNEKWRGMALVEVVEVLAKKGEIKSANKVLALVSDDERKGAGQAAIAAAYARKKNYRMAASALKHSKSAHWRGETQSRLAQIYYRQKKRRESEDMVKSIESAWVRSRTYADLALAARSAKRKKESKRYFDMAIKTAERMQEPVTQGTALFDVAKRLADIGREEQALELIQKSKSADSKNGVYAYLARKHAAAGRFEEAQRMLANVGKDPIWKADVLGNVARSRVKKGHYGEALDIAADIPLLELRLPSTAEIAVRHASAGQKADDALVRKLSRNLEVNPKADEG